MNKSSSIRTESEKAASSSSGGTAGEGRDETNAAASGLTVVAPSDWTYEVLSVGGQWIAETKCGESPDANLFVVRNLRQVLWSVSIQGPDDLYALPTRLAALERANELNAFFAKLEHHEYDPIMRAFVIEWPYSAEAHAADIAKQSERAALTKATA